MAAARNSGVRAPRAIQLPRRAPIVAIRTPHDAAWQTANHVAAIPTRAVLDPSLTATTFRVLTVLACHADKAGLTRVGQLRLAMLLGRSQQLISRHIKILIASGIIKVAYRMPIAGGHQLNVYRLMFGNDDTLTLQDARSIAQPDAASQRKHNKHNTQAVVLDDTTPTVVYADLSTSLTTPQCGTYTTQVDGLQALHPECSKKLEGTTTSHYTLKNAEAVLSHWQTCAMIHDLPNIIANEADLAIAHQLVASGITASQLEDAIVDNPNARLEPIVRSLLP